MKINNNSSSSIERINEEYFVDKSAFLGSGSYAKVYKGYDLKKKPIAVKVIDTRKYTNKLEREIEVMSRLR
jgi:serine/threonine protein kinase